MAKQFTPDTTLLDTFAETNDVVTPVVETAPIGGTTASKPANGEESRYVVRRSAGSQQSTSLATGNGSATKAVELFNASVEHFGKSYPRLTNLKFDVLGRGADEVLLAHEKLQGVNYVHVVVLHDQKALAMTPYRTPEYACSNKELETINSYAGVLGQGIANELRNFREEWPASDWAVKENFDKMVKQRLGVDNLSEIKIAGLSEVYDLPNVLKEDVGSRELGNILQVVVNNLAIAESAEANNPVTYTGMYELAKKVVQLEVDLHATVASQNGQSIDTLPLYAPVQLTSKTVSNNADLSEMAQARAGVLGTCGGYIDLVELNRDKAVQIAKSMGRVDPLQINALKYCAQFVMTSSTSGDDSGLTLQDLLRQLALTPVLNNPSALGRLWHDAVYPAGFDNDSVDAMTSIEFMGYNFGEQDTIIAGKQVGGRPLQLTSALWEKNDHHAFLNFVATPAVIPALELRQSGEYSSLLNVLTGIHDQSSKEWSQRKAGEAIYQAAIDVTDGEILSVYNPDNKADIILEIGKSTPWGIYSTQEGTFDIRRKWNLMNFLNQAGQDGAAAYEKLANQWFVLMSSKTAPGFNPMPEAAREHLVIEEMRKMVSNLRIIDRTIRVSINPSLTAALAQCLAKKDITIQTSAMDTRSNDTAFVRGGFGGDAFTTATQSTMQQTLNVTSRF